MVYRFRRSLALIVLSAFLSQILLPSFSLAMGGGPTQPEFDQFSPMADPDMVDPFTGNVKYNIPLLEIGGYPVNLAYQGGSGMEDEASWVGLGWNVNVGAINRVLRGLPDDYKGDQIVKEYKRKPNETWGINAGAKLQIAGFDEPDNASVPDTVAINLSFGLGIFKNSYTGYGLSIDVNPSISAGFGGGGSMTAGLGLSFNSQEGMSTNASIQASTQILNSQSLNAFIGSSYNTRGGLQNISYGLTYSEKTKTTTTQSGQKWQAQSSLGASHGISLMPAAYLPTIEFPHHNYSFALSGTVGFEGYTLHPNVNLKGFYSKQKYDRFAILVPSYGYMYSDYGTSAGSLKDFLREGDIPYTKGLPNLAFPTFTYDQFVVSGENIGGQFRPYRSDIGILHDNLTQTTSESGSAGAEVGIGNTAHAGGNSGYTEVVTTTTKWRSDNDILPYIDFQNQEPYTGYEKFYFKQAGALHAYENSLSSSTFSNFPLRVKLKPKKDHAERNFDIFSPTLQQQPTLNINEKQYKKSRETRYKSFSFLNAAEAKVHALNKSINSYPVNNLVLAGCDNPSQYGNTFIQKISRSTKSAHHMSEVTVVDEQGKRFIYGIPSYTNLHKEVTFSVSEQAIEPENGIIQYGTTDNWFSNTKGNDNLFTADSKPPYANAFLLTEVLSPNYVDVTGDGISNDDYGDAVKFNYSLVDKNFLTRAPIGHRTAYYNSGLNSGNGSISSVGDAKGSYIYNKKELWYLHSIESNTHVALFIISDREDGLGVYDVNGQPNKNERVKLLSEIKLYTKAEYVKNGLNAIPVKTVRFVYDYSSCPGIPNNSTDIIDNSSGAITHYLPVSNINAQAGKLTLKNVYFTYGSNYRGKLQPYSFDYNLTVFGDTVNYKMKKMDRWGTYKSNSNVSAYHNIYGKANGIYDSEFPYTIQDTTYSNEFARLWNISKIDLPSGGTINIDYEADDYWAVQDRFSQQMYFIEGFSNSNTASSLTNETFDSSGNPNRYIFIRVPDQTGAAPNDLKVRFLKNVVELFYRVSIDLGNKGIYDFLNGYAQIDYEDPNFIGLSSFDNKVIYIKLKTSENNHPIAKTAWQFIRSYAQELMYKGSQANASIVEALEGLVGAIGEITTMFSDYTKKTKKDKLGKYVNLNKSWVRLSDVDGKKIGGGHRVSAIYVTDNWDAMTSSSTNNKQTYTTLYDYTTSFNGQVISSGVASYEPKLGQEENVFKSPIHYRIKRSMGPDDHLYLEEPFGELMYPSASVGYSKITTSKFKPAGISRTGTGKNVKRFYTSNDFPLVSKRTPIDPNHRVKPLPNLSFIYSSIRDYQGVTQGYLVELNDMHGKLKSDSTYDETGKLVASTFHKYKQTRNSDGKNILDNMVKVVNEHGQVSDKDFGVDYEIWTDMREQSTVSTGVTTTVNAEIFFVVPAPAPIIIPPIIPTFVDNETRFRSAVTVKCISRYGVLDETITSKNGSSIAQRNMIFDEKTGDVVLTQTTNEFHDSIYSYSAKSHWAYDRLGLATENINTKLLKVTKVVNGQIIWPGGDPNDYIKPGDEIEYFAVNTIGRKRLWAIKNTSGDIRLIDRQGNLFNLDLLYIPFHLKIIRSGNKNMSTLPIESFSTINTSPYSTVFDSITLKNLDIINTEAFEYKESWKIDCEKVMVFNCEEFSPDTFCINSLLNNMIQQTDSAIYPLYTNTSLNDSVLVMDILGPYSSCLSDSTIFNYEPFSTNYIQAITPLNLANQYQYFEWQIGPNCFMTMVSSDPNPLDFNNLHIGGPMEGLRCYNVESYTQDSIGTYLNRVSGYVCLECDNCQAKCTDVIKSRDIVNPFLTNIQNNWHLNKTYKYYTKRNANAFTASTLKSDGEFKDYTSFWKFTSDDMLKQGHTNPKWVNTNTITAINKRTTPIEEQDALGIYSSMIYGYENDYPKASVSNSRIFLSGNDNFEDYTYFKACFQPCWKGAFSFIDAVNRTDIILDTTQAHTGHNSLLVTSGNRADYKTDVYIAQGNAASESSSDVFSINRDQISLDDACISKFTPQPGDYLISGWINEQIPCTTRYDQGSIFCQVDSSGAALNTASLTTSGPIIDGWQRIEGKFTIPNNADKFKISLIAGSNNVLFDDIRILPYDANMKSYVYSGSTQKLMAELDENNYATFYEYDDAGALIRIKKETERGIITIKEGRKSTKIQ